VVQPRPETAGGCDRRDAQARDARRRRAERAAQDAWARSWSTRVTRRGPDREAVDPLAEMSAREALNDDCLRTWAAWAQAAWEVGETRRGPAGAGMQGCCS
jgi:hypothetical protein